jgi:nucleoside-diphosphate-sugar epimerase
VTDVLVLGLGYTGSAIARLAEKRGLSTFGTRRRDGPLTAELLTARLGPNTHVVVCFPPDGTTDAAIAPIVSGHAITYLSSTAVYGDGLIDDTTPVLETPSPRREAEKIWQRAGATILRCPAIYGSDRGIHVRIQRGEYAIGGDGTSFTSRIHVDDLAQLVLATRDVRGETFVVGDAEPATQNDICVWVATEFGVPMPPHVPLDRVHPTLRGNRRVDGSRALRTLGVTLQYPTYREGLKRSSSAS